MKGTVKRSKDFNLNRELIKKAQQGCEDAKTELIHLNAGLVEDLTRRYMGRPEDYDDIFQTANLALLKAIERFDLSKTNQFSTYAYISIKGEILNYFRSNSTITKKRTSNNLYKKIQDIKYGFYASNGYYPSIEQIAIELNEDADEIKNTILENQPLTYLSHSPSQQNEETSMVMENVISSNDDDPYEAVLLSEVIKDNLTEEETKIFNYNLDGLGRREMARLIGVSEGKIRYTLQKISDKLSNALSMDYQ